MTLYIYDPDTLAVVAQYDGESNEECIAAAERDNYPGNDYAASFSAPRPTLPGVPIG